MPRKFWQALRYITECIKSGFRFKSGQCKLRCREAYLIPSDGSPDAIAAWSRTEHRFFHQWVPGAFMWWVGGTPDENGKRHGHVAICGWRKGRIRTVDFPNVGRWNNTTVAELEKEWPRIVYAGMSLDIDGVKVRRFPAITRKWSHP